MGIKGKKIGTLASSGVKGFLNTKSITIYLIQQRRRRRRRNVLQNQDATKQDVRELAWLEL